MNFRKYIITKITHTHTFTEVWQQRYAGFKTKQKIKTKNTEKQYKLD